MIGPAERDAWLRHMGDAVAHMVESARLTPADAEELDAYFVMAAQIAGQRPLISRGRPEDAARAGLVTDSSKFWVVMRTKSCAIPSASMCDLQAGRVQAVPQLTFGQLNAGSAPSNDALGHIGAGRRAAHHPSDHAGRPARSDRPPRRSRRAR